MKRKERSVSLRLIALPQVLKMIQANGLDDVLEFT